MKEHQKASLGSRDGTSFYSLPARKGGEKGLVGSVCALNPKSLNPRILNNDPKPHYPKILNPKALNPRALDL